MSAHLQKRYIRRKKVLLLVSSLASLVLLLLSAFEENVAGSWRPYQKAYRTALIQRATTDRARTAAERMTLGFQQVYLPALGRVDRCITCHVGIEDPAQADAPQPLAAHSGDVLKIHSVARFGCTICHDGQGRGVDADDAHGEVLHWGSPLLRGEAVYTSCSRCHYENDLYGAEHDLFARAGPPEPLDEQTLSTSVPGVTDPEARAIARGKQRVLDSGCLGCHAYRKRGGTLGPDITHVGDKTAHDFDFAGVQGPHTVENWMFEHFKRPAQVSPGTLMPDMNLSDEKLRDLSQYMLSLHRKDVPAAYTPVPRYRRGSPASGKRLYDMFCNACHGQQGQGSTVLDPELMMLADPPQQLMTPAINNPDTLAVASDDYFRHIIQTGRRGTNMIAWGGDEGNLLEEEVDRLVAHIRDWEGDGPPLASINAARGDAQHGRALYQSRCLSCHGSQGEGGIGVALSSPSFLAVASDTFLARTIVNGRANTAMPSWKQLTADQVSDLLAFIRSWQRAAPDKQQVLSKLAAIDEPSQASVRVGRALYRGNCATCHGSEGQGGMGPSLNSDALLAVVDDAYLYNAIVLGRPGTAMPAWQHLSVDDVVDLIGLMRSWNDRRRQELEPYWASGDPQRGELIYRGNCAACHGTHAQGVTGSQLSNPVFLGSASDAMLRHWIRLGKPDTAMRAFAKGFAGVNELTEGQIDDVVAYLRRLEVDRPLVTARAGMGIVPRGAEIYAGACAQCHGEHGQGTTGSALANPDFLQAASDGFLQATIVLGRDGTAMRAMGKAGQGNVELSPDDINNVVAFIRSWQRQPPGQPTARRYVLSANLIEGRQLYAGYCAGCHGGDGADGWAPALNNADFLAAATDGFLQATIARGRTSTPMRAFGRGGGGVAELSGEQINNIVAFIRSWDQTTKSQSLSSSQ